MKTIASIAAWMAYAGMLACAASSLAEDLPRAGKDSVAATGNRETVDVHAADGDVKYSGVCDELGCEDACCSNECCSYSSNSRWIVRASALALHRSRPDPVVLLENPNNPTQNLNAGDFHFGYRAGFDLSVLRQFDGPNAIEARYFSVDGWSADANAVTATADPLRINTDPPIFFVNGRSIAAEYGSLLRSTEINWYRQTGGWLDWLAGFRALELNERWHANLVDAVTPAPTSQYDVATRNHLYGFQLGGQGPLWDLGGRLRVTGIGKAGIYGNAAAQNSVFNTGVVFTDAGGTKGQAAFVGELGLTSSFRLTDHLSIRSGYQLLWIEGVALATDQVGRSNFFTNTGLDSSGGVFYHGGLLGLECLW